MLFPWRQKSESLYEFLMMEILLLYPLTMLSAKSFLLTAAEVTPGLWLLLRKPWLSWSLKTLDFLPSSQWSMLEGHMLCLLSVVFCSCWFKASNLWFPSFICGKMGSISRKICGACDNSFVQGRRSLNSKVSAVSYTCACKPDFTSTGFKSWISRWVRN